MSTNAYAAGATATYNDTNDIVNPVDAGSIKSVVITNSSSNTNITTNNIFYIDQAPSGSVLNSAAGFAITKDAPTGTYYMTLRYNDNITEKIPFTVKNNIKSDDMPMVLLPGSIENGNADEFSVAFVTENLVNLSEYKTVKFAFTADGTTKYFGYYLDDMKDKMKSSKIDLGIPGGQVFFGIRLTEIESTYRNGSGGANVSMWLSKDENFKKEEENNNG